MKILFEQGFQHIHGFRPLQVYLGRGGGKVGQGHALGQALAQGREVPGGAGRVDDNHEGVRAKTVDNAVIQHAAFGVEQKTVTASARRKGGQIMTHRPGQGGIRARPLNAEFAHMTDIEKTGMLTGVLVLDQNAFILDGHEPAGEGSHFGPVRLMPRGERRTQFRHGFSLCDLERGRSGRGPSRQPVIGACTVACPATGHKKPTLPMQQARRPIPQNSGAFPQGRTR